MTFLPKAEVLTLEELERLCLAFIAKGVERLRITGGEPLVRKNVMRLFERLGARIGDGAEGTHPHHQWQPAGALCARPWRRRA